LTALAQQPTPPGAAQLPLDDEELEVRWRGGSAAAFSELFRRHYRGAVGYARGVLGDAAAAEDVAQQAFLNLLQRRQGRGRFRALLYTAVRNLALNERRRRRRKYVAQTGLTEEPVRHERAPVAGLIADEERVAVDAALAELAPDEREALCLKETRGLTYREIGQVMSLHPDAVRRRVARALTRLRTLLGRSPDP